MLRSATVALALMALPVSAAAATDLAWDTLTGTTLNVASLPIVGRSQGSVDVFSLALVFTAGASGNVSSVTVPIAADLATPEMVFALFADGGSAPGSALGTAVQVTTTAGPASPDLATLSGWGGAALTSGSDYWLVASIADPATGGFWFAGSPDQAGEWFFSADGGTSWSEGVGTIPLARIVVERVTPVPLPAGLPLLAGGLLLIRAVRRRA